MVIFDPIGHYRHFMIWKTCPNPPLKKGGQEGSGKEYFTTQTEKLISRTVIFLPKNPFLRWNILREPADGGLANKFLIDSLQTTSLNINSLKINGLETTINLKLFHWKGYPLKSLQLISSDLILLCLQLLNFQFSL